MIMSAMDIVACTIIIPIAFGKTWLQIISKCVLPATFAASIYSWEVIAITVALSIRTNPGTLATVIAIKRFVVLAPKVAITHKENKILGIHISVSAIRVMTLSIQPPKYPAMTPKNPPMHKETVVEISPMERETLDP